MSFKIVRLPPDVEASWPEKIRQAVPGAEEILLENCRRFAKNTPLLNVVDKEKWY
jgi:hypothetical protein